ncbi:nitroreductase [Clostridium tetanomorphum]|uniref:Nitroreductase n=1 Tax=Clostridium tetanomorphum TaxID=1553 RepID=A0A923EEK3_CLOTT|nr:nitroreductase family protein [Clostridium tetanomorphum]KAJ49434.1 nitroreductase family protein [Clostridium tetanomorphum DSM 665]KAJ52313.1 nitroreductase family protein [Clostridium tetanomorphum DSM 665]MBC2399558.1 nitroreductase [Clostridium tetanomorphum]MBP1866302.1 nitroreductase [Clostridium tetanomorphum]NRS85793.1 nitroreductase [Clostridium tetanomorphum]
MQFYDVIENRKSIKKFKNTAISKDKVARMITAAMMSPSWKNKTSYKFILVEDANKREQLANTIMNKTDETTKSIKDAPMTAVIVADPSKSGVVDEREYYLVDSAIAMEHFILAATAEGYGTCWVGAVDEDKIREVLNIPKDYRVIAMTPVGEIGENKEHYEKKDVRDYVFLDSWNKAYTNEISNIKH